MEMRLLAEDYVKGRMNKDQVKAFEESMEVDNDLKLVVAHFQSIELAVDGMLEDDLFETVANVTEGLRSESDQSNKQPKSIQSKRKKPWLPLLILFLCAMMLWIVFRSTSSKVFDRETENPPKIDQSIEVIETAAQEKEVEVKDLDEETNVTDSIKILNNKPKKNQKKLNTEQLFAQNFSPYRHPSLEPTVRGASDPTHRDEFELAYWEADYDQVMDSWSALTVKEQENSSLMFLYANALMAEHKILEAVKILERLQLNSNKRFDRAEKWNLALCYTFLGNQQQAKAHLEQVLRDKSSPYSSLALILLDKISK